MKEKFQKAKQNIMKKEKKSNALLTSKAEFSSVPFRFLKLSLSTTCFKESVIFLKPSFLYSSAFVYIFNGLIKETLSDHLSVGFLGKRSSAPAQPSATGIGRAFGRVCRVHLSDTSEWIWDLGKCWRIFDASIRHLWGFLRPKMFGILLSCFLCFPFFFPLFSRVHATLQPALSVGRSVGRSVGHTLLFLSILFLYVIFSHF